jgi:hypothetical protein
VLFINPAPLAAVVVAAMSRVDHDGSEIGGLSGGREQTNGRECEKLKENFHEC